MISKLIEKYKDQSGNVYVALLSGIALIGIVGTTTFSLLSGPLSSMTEVNKKTVAKTQLNSIARITILDATHKTNQGDCDSDAYVEPEAGRDSSLAGYDFVPYTLGAPVTDPWGNNYAYCTWDIGTVQDDAACGGPSAQRYAGTPNAFTGHADTQKVLALFTAGPDGTFESTCANYVDDTTAVFTCNGDDICQHYTYAEAATATASYWNLKTGDPTIAETGKKVEVGSGGVALDTTTGAATFGAVSSTGKVIADGGAVLATDSVLDAATCMNSADTGLLRYNETSDMLEVCDGSIPDWVDATTYTAGPPVPGGVAGDSVPITTVQTKDGTGTGAPTVTLDTNVTVGNTIIVLVRVEASSAGTAYIDDFQITDNLGNIYTVQANTIDTWGGTNVDVQGFIVTAPVTTGGAATLTLTTTASGSVTPSRVLDYSILEVSGLNNDNLVNISVTDTGTMDAGTHEISSGVSTDTINQFAVALHVVHGCCGQPPFNYGYNPEWTQHNYNNNVTEAHHFVSKAITSPQTVTHEWTFDNSTTRTFGSALVTLRADEGGKCTPEDADSEWYCDAGNLSHLGGKLIIGDTAARDFDHYDIETGLTTQTPLPVQIYADQDKGIDLYAYSDTDEATIDFTSTSGTEDTIANLPTLAEGTPIGKFSTWAYTSANAHYPAWGVYNRSLYSATNPETNLFFEKSDSNHTNGWDVMSLNNQGDLLFTDGFYHDEYAGPLAFHFRYGRHVMLDSDNATPANGSKFIFRYSEGTEASPAALYYGDRAIGAIGISDHAYGGYDYTGNFSLSPRLFYHSSENSLATFYRFQFGAWERMRLSPSGRIGIDDMRSGRPEPRGTVETIGAFRVTHNPDSNPIYSGSGEATFLYRPENNSLIIGGNGASNLGTSGRSSWSSGGNKADPGDRCVASGDYSFCHGKSGLVSGESSYMLNGDTDAVISGNYSYCLQCLNNGSRGTTIAGDYAVASGSGLNIGVNGDYAVSFGRVTTGTPSVDASHAYAFGDNINITSAATGSFVFNLSNAAVSVAQPHTLFFLNGKVGVGGINTSYDLYVDGTAGLSSGTTWTLTSDARLKDIHGDYTRGIDDISKLEPVLFSYKKDNPLDLPSDKVMSGFIAQDVQKVFPEAISTGAQDYLQFDIQSINIAMINAVKDLNAEQQALLTEQRQLEAEQAGLHSDYQDLRAEMDTLLKQTGLKSQSAKLRESHIFLAISIPVLLVLVGSGLYRRRNQKSA